MQPRPRAACLLLVIPLLLGAGLASNSGSNNSNKAISLPRSPAGLYEAACARCHGNDGTGMARDAVGFDTPLPDFSDCSFSTREPDADWGAVVAHGGPVRVFDKMMPAFGEALTELQAKKALQHVRSFCEERRSWPRGELNLPRPLVTSKAFPEDEAVVSTSVGVEGNRSVMNKLIYEHRIGARGQFELIFPIGFLQRDEGDWTGGVGDIGLATKWALLHSADSGSILSLAFEVFLPTGDEDRGLGKGVTVLEPFLAFGQILPYDSFVHLQAGAELSTKPDDVKHELFWRAALGISLAEKNFGRTWSPIVEVLAARELEDGAVINWDVVPQLQVTLSKRQHVMLCAGVRLPINDFGARATHVMAYLLWDWFDGSVLEGWW